MHLNGIAKRITALALGAALLTALPCLRLPRAHSRST